MADGGTVFLDEIGEMPLDMQTRLLRVIEEGTVTRIGSATESVVNVRIIAATNKDLNDEVAAGNIRELENLVELVVNAGTIPHLWPWQRRTESPATKLRDTRQAEPSTELLAYAERRHIDIVLARHDGNLSEAARALGIARNTLYSKLGLGTGKATSN